MPFEPSQYIAEERARKSYFYTSFKQASRDPLIQKVRKDKDKVRRLTRETQVPTVVDPAISGVDAVSLPGR